MTVIDGATNTVRSREAGVSEARGVIVSPATNKTFLLSNESSVLTLDGSLDPALPTIAAGTQGNAIAVDSDTNTIYAGSIDYSGSANSLTVFDGATRTPITTGISTMPFAIAVNTTTHKAYAATADVNSSLPGSLKVLDATGAITASVVTGRRPIAVAVNPVTNKIYVANSTSNTVTVVDGATNTTSTVAVGTTPTAIAVNKATNKIYVCNTDSNTMTVINGATNTTSTISGGGGAGGGGLPTGIAVNETTNKIYVATLTEVKMIDGVTQAVTTLASFTAPYVANPRTVRVNAATNKIYTVLDPRYLMEIDGSTNVVTNIPLGLEIRSTSANVEINPAVNNVYVTVGDANHVIAVDPTTGTHGYIGVSHGPIAVSVDTGTNTFYAIGGDGLVTEVHDVVGTWSFLTATHRYEYAFYADYTFEAFAAPICRKPPCLDTIDYYTGTYALSAGRYALTSTDGTHTPKLTINGNRLVGTDFGTALTLERH